MAGPNDLLASAKDAAASAQKTVGNAAAGAQKTVGNAAAGVHKTVGDYATTAANYVKPKPDPIGKTKGAVDGAAKSVGGLFK